MINDFLTYLVSLLSFDSSHPLLFTQIHFWVFLTIIYSLFCFIVSVGERRSRRKSPGKTNTMSTARRLWRNGYLFLVSLCLSISSTSLIPSWMAWATSLQISATRRV